MKLCPSELCINHTNPPKNWYVKNGYFMPKNTNQKTPRYQCKACSKSFSTHTDKPTAYQKKPELNDELFKMLVSGVSMRRASELLAVKYDTVLLHFDYLAMRAKEEHIKFLKTVQTTFVQVDEMETFLHARAKPLSVPMVVRVKTGHILGFQIAKMPARGTLADIGVAKYNWITDERSKKFQSMLLDIKHCFKEQITFKCDSHTSYPKWITSQIPHAKLEQVLGGKKPKAKLDGEKAFDQLFAINNTFARMRHDMNRLARKSWSTTKAIHGLENHIWLYIAWNNGYKIK